MPGPPSKTVVLYKPPALSVSSPLFISVMKMEVTTRIITPQMNPRMVQIETERMRMFMTVPMYNNTFISSIKKQPRLSMESGRVFGQGWCQHGVCLSLVLSRQMMITPHKKTAMIAIHAGGPIAKIAKVKTDPPKVSRKPSMRSAKVAPI